MANNTEERLIKEFSKVTGSSSKTDASPITTGSTPKASVPKAETPKASSSQTLTRAFSGAADTTGAASSYRAPTASGSSSQSSGGSGGLLGAAESVGKGVLSDLGVLPLIGSLFGLFGSSPAQTTFQKYEKPSSISFTGSTVGNSLVNSDYNALGMPRLYNPAPSASSPSAPAASPAASTGSTAASSSSGGSSPQISVNVQAMDAKSFMDYSGQIAQAVRDAMLNMSSINDVVTEL